jgi:RNA 2',3'-cyclic 3'-phosphodiesterase
VPRRGEPPPRARLFVALELPAGPRQQLAAWAGDIAHSAGRAVRPVELQNLHVTLCFLGYQPETEIPAIAAACEAATTAGQIPLALEDTIWLPPRRPRVLAVRLVDVGRVLEPLQRRLSKSLADAGWYEPERRAYLPHVTVARVRGDARLRRLDLPPLPAVEQFAGAAVALMRSHLGRGGARYEAVWALPFR